MKNAEACARKLASLLKSIGDVPAPSFPDEDDPVATLVLSFLMWEATTEQAVAAYQRVKDSIVDYNDLRVSMPHEVMEWLGEDYPLAADRAQRLRAVLRHIYLREHMVSLEVLTRMGKRDARKYLDSLEGIVPYVAARVMLLSFGTHAIPADQRLCDHLIEVGAADPSVEVPALGVWLSRQIKAENGVAAYFALQAWSDQQAASGRGRKSGTQKAAVRE